MNQKKFLKEFYYIFLFLFFIIALFLNFKKSNLNASGDELNSLLIYSFSYKTLLLKNLPGNVAPFHLLGYLLSFFTYNYFFFKILSFIFFFISLFISLQIIKDNIFRFFLLFIIFYSNYSLYFPFSYSGYYFSSFLFVCLFFFINKNFLYDGDIKKILIILFFLLCSHIVNIYLVFPVIFIMIFHKKFRNLKLNDFIIFFLLPTFLFYFFSIIVTGYVALKLNNDSFILFLSTLLNINFFFKIINNGISAIFFNDVYNYFLSDNYYKYFLDFYNEDKFYFFLFSLLFFIFFLKLFKKEIDIYFYIIFFHFLLFFFINKAIFVRSYTGFFLFYYLVIANHLIQYKNLINKKLLIFSKILINILIIKLIINFDVNELKNKKQQTGYSNFQYNLVQIDLLKNDCTLNTKKKYDEIGIKVYYYLYLNNCNANYNLKEFHSFYKTSKNLSEPLLLR